jgi:hypothetical protein
MDTVLGWSHVQTTSLKASLGSQLRICRAPGQVRRSHRFVGDRVLTIVAVHSMAILGGVDGTNDELGCQKTARIQKGVWKGLPPPEEGYDTVFILNCVIHRFWLAASYLKCRWGRTFSVIRVVSMHGHLTIIYATRELVILTQPCGTARALITHDQRYSYKYCQSRCPSLKVSFDFKALHAAIL